MSAIERFKDLDDIVEDESALPRLQQGAPRVGFTLAGKARATADRVGATSAQMALAPGRWLRARTARQIRIQYKESSFMRAALSHGNCELSCSRNLVVLKTPEAATVAAGRLCTIHRRTFIRTEALFLDRAAVWWAAAR
ncbi:hypothetical protein [Streptomyces sp. NPDC050982]|uniref:hypothetical protein n=1 Tax=Streptomyces sp. NPDC050982 TaxID=3154746 RepID=UPI003401983F